MTDKWLDNFNDSDVHKMNFQDDMLSIISGKYVIYETQLGSAISRSVTRMMEANYRESGAKDKSVEKCYKGV